MEGGQEVGWILEELWEGVRGEYDQNALSEILNDVITVYLE